MLTVICARWMALFCVILLLVGCGGGGDAPASGVNQAPTANAGADADVSPSQSVTIDGSGSSDADGSIVTYAWTQTQGPTLTLSGANTSQLTFTAPTVTVTTLLAFQLTVTDNTGATSSDTVQVIVSVASPGGASNQVPVANAGFDKLISGGIAVTLDGSGSSDADGVIAAYDWTQTQGPSVTLTGANTSQATFTAPQVTADTILAFQLTVTDDQGSSHTDTVLITLTLPSYNITPYTITASAPSVVTMAQRISDRATGAPVTGLKLSDFQVLEDDLALAPGEGFLDLEPLDTIPSQLKTVLMIDISASLTTADLAMVKQAATNIVTNLAANQLVAIYTFDDVVSPVIAFTNDADALNQAISGITLGGPSTNLYGAVVEGLGLWTNTFALDQINYGTMILITDGNDTASLSTLSSAITAKDNRELYALTVGASVNRDPLVQLVLGQQLTSITQADRDLAANYLFAVNDYSQVNDALQQIASKAANLTQGVYLLYYATPKRAGTHTVRVSIANNAPCSLAESVCKVWAEGTFDATGFSNVVPELLVSSPGQWLSAGQSYPLSARVRWANGPFTYTWALTNADGQMSLAVDPADSSISSLSTVAGTLVSQGSVNVGVTELTALNKTLPFNIGIAVREGSFVYAQVSPVMLTGSRTNVVLTADITCPQCTWSVTDAAVATLSATVGQNVTLQRGTTAGTTTLMVSDPLSGLAGSFTVNTVFGVSALAKVSVGSLHSCALDGVAGTCWGDNSSGQATVPALSNPTQIAAGSGHNCAIDDMGVKCWGSGYWEQTTVPVLSNPTQIAAGERHSCAIDDTGVKCWGSNMDGQTTVPVLSNPTQIVAGSLHSCVIDDAGVKCWGSNINGQATVPVLSNPTQIAAGSSHSCAIDDTGVKCWGSNAAGQTTVPALSNPTQIAAGTSHNCAIDDTGVKCWGGNTYGQTTVPALSNPTQIAAGLWHTCAVDDMGVKCWGDNTYGQTTVPW